MGLLGVVASDLVSNDGAPVPVVRLKPPTRRYKLGTSAVYSAAVELAAMPEKPTSVSEARGLISA